MHHFGAGIKASDGTTTTRYSSDWTIIWTICDMIWAPKRYSLVDEGPVFVKQLVQLLWPDPRQLRHRLLSRGRSHTPLRTFVNAAAGEKTHRNH